MWNMITFVLVFWLERWGHLRLGDGVTRGAVLVLWAGSIKGHHLWSRPGHGLMVPTALTLELGRCSVSA